MLGCCAAAGLAGALVCMWGTIASADAGSDWTTASRVTTVEPGSARLIVGNQLTDKVAANTPAGADLRALTVVPATGGYIARVFFTTPFVQIDSYQNKPISHVVFISLRPPSGNEVQVQMLPGGKGQIQEVSNGKLVTTGAVTPSVENGHVVLPLPGSLHAKPEWEIQAHVIMLEADGSGFHKHSRPASMGSLTGEGPAREMTFPASGVVIHNGRYLYWKHADLPPEARPIAFQLDRSVGKLFGVLTLAAPFKPVASIGGKAVADQGAQIAFFTDPQAKGGYVLFWDALGKQAIVADATNPQNPKSLGQAPFTVSGSKVRFDLGLIPFSTPKTPSATLLDGLATDVAAQESNLKYVDVVASAEDKNGDGVVVTGTDTSVDGLLPPSQSTIPPTGHQGGGGLFGAIVGVIAGGVLLGGWWRFLVPVDWCDELRRLCEEARARAAAAAARAKAARDRANAAQKACDEAKHARQRAQAATQAGESWIEGSEHPDERLTSGDLALQNQAASELRAAHARGEIDAHQLEQGLSRWGDPNYWHELREKAQADLKAAQAKEDMACKDAATADAEAAAADAEAAELQAVADAICKLAAECVELQSTPTPAEDPGLPPPPRQPVGPLGGVSIPVPEIPEIHSHDEEVHKPCCPSGDYIGVLASEEGGLGLISWGSGLLALGFGKFREVLWGEEPESLPLLGTGHDYWQGTIWCVDDPSKFARFSAKSVREGIDFGGGAGAVVIYCTGRDHPSEVVNDLPSMMSGYSFDIAGIVGLVRAFKHLNRFPSLWRTVRLLRGSAKMERLGPELKTLTKWLVGENIIGRGVISSRAQGAPGCWTIPIGLSVQIGVWKVNAENVRFEVDEYSCCSHCADKFAQSGAEIVEIRQRGW